MKIIMHFLDDPISLIMLTILGIYFSFVTAALAMLRYNFQYNQKRKDELNKAIAKGFQLQTIETINDLVNIYKGVYKLGSDDISYKAKLGKVLRAYFAQIISNASIHMCPN